MNKYEILGVSGEGAYGVVLKCRNKETNELVAIKKFKDTDDPEDSTFKKTTLREVKILKNAQHPHIVCLKEAFKRKQRLYLVFEYCEKTLLELIEDSPGGIPIETVKLLTFQMLRGVEFLWEFMEICHRDLKPENLLLVKKHGEWTLKLCDFGFARHINSAQTAGGAGNFPQSNLTDYVATRWYRSPELLLNATDYNQTVDIWAAALIISEMITSEPLFAGDSDVDQLYLIQRVLGNLTRKQMEKFLRNPKFIGVEFPTSRPEGLEKKLTGKIKDKQAISLLKMMLKMDPAERPSATQCLDHEFFDSVRQRALQLEMKCMEDMGIRPLVKEPQSSSNTLSGDISSTQLQQNLQHNLHTTSSHPTASITQPGQAIGAGNLGIGHPVTTVPTSSGKPGSSHSTYHTIGPSGATMNVSGINGPMVMSNFGQHHTNHTNYPVHNVHNTVNYHYPVQQSLSPAAAQARAISNATRQSHYALTVEDSGLPFLPASRSGSRAAKVREAPSRGNSLTVMNVGGGNMFLNPPKYGAPKNPQSRGALLPKIRDSRY